MRVIIQKPESQRIAEGHEHLYHLTNMLLADRMAAAYGHSRHAAITRWARRAQAGRPNGDQLRETCRTILRARPHRAIEAVKQLWNQLHADGFLDQPWRGDAEQ